MGYKFLKKLAKVDEVIALVSKKLKTELTTEEIDFDKSLGSVLAEDIISSFNLPPVNKSAFEGYAVRGTDVLSASQYYPVRLRVIGEIKIGVGPTIESTQGKAIKVVTGSALPNGFDTVVPVEYVRASDDEIEVSKSFPIGDNVIQRGEDVKKGQKVIRKGKIIDPFDMAMLAHLKQTRVKVLEKLRIAIIPTGSELIEPYEVGDVYKTVNTNAYALSALCKEHWIEARRLSVVQDDLEALTHAVRSSIEDHHALIMTGGTSVGESDLVPESVRRAGKVDLVIRGIGIQPGRPTGVAVLNGKPVFMLSGFPVACIVGFMALVRPLLYMMVGAMEPPRPIVKAVLKSRVSSSLGVVSYVRVKVRRKDEGLVAEPIRVLGSSAVSSLTEANGFLMVPIGSEGFDGGSEVEVLLYSPIQG
ncbi:MAG: molybdopterin molybdotransferase MoeA [Nitrososphaerales archaeon]|nr:molybdopterin molybdotransferase MoeA [Nitrososphaerales archaeon]